MSLMRIALRIAAVEALKGRTLVGNNVLDTPNGALDIQADGSLRTDEEKPFISVFTDQGKAENVSGRSLIENGLCDIIFEMGISSAMLEVDEETEDTVIVGINIPGTDRNREFFLDIVQRQISDALNDPANAWAEIYRGLHYNVVKIEFAGARNTEDGQRLAGHQMRLTVQLADDPVKGAVLDEGAPFLQFLSAIEASGDRSYIEQAAMIRSVISGPSDAWGGVQRRQGMTNSEMLALGLEPSLNDAEIFDEAKIEVEGVGTVTVTPP